jgi:hypothetical protein
MGGGARTGFSLRTWRVILLLACAAAAVFPGAAAADGLNAFMEFDFTRSDIKSTDPSGVSARANLDSFIQRYNINIDKNPYPLLQLRAGGIFEYDMVNSTSEGTTNRANATQISPNASMSLSDTVFPVNLGYTRRETKSAVNGIASPTMISDSYSASLGWHPAELPPWDFSYLRANQFDKDRTITDRSTDNFTWSSTYKAEKLNLSYQGSYGTTTDRRGNLGTESLNNTGQVSYADQFFRNRVNLQTNYTLSLSETSITSTGQGEILSTPSLINGALFKVTPDNTTVPPVTVTDGALPPNGGLSDGTARVNIVAVAPLPPGTQDNFGLDLARQVPVSTLYLPVISGTNPRPANISQIAGRFVWAVYTSDSVNGDHWTRVQTVTQTFGTDPSGVSDTVGFILDFATVSTRFIKAVVTPVQVTALPPPGLIPGVTINSILVTRIQPFRRQPAASFPGGKTKNLTGLYNLAARVILLNAPNLSYDMSFTLLHSNSDTDSSKTFYVSNGLSLVHRFNAIFSGFARVAISNNKAQGAPLTSNISASAALNVTPLPTLNHSIVYNASIGYTNGKQNSQNALFLNNSVGLYKGVSLSVNGGVSTATSSNGRISDSTVLNAGISVNPHKRLTLGITYGEQASKSSGGGSPDSADFSRRISASAAYNPFDTLYLNGSWNMNMQKNQPTGTTQNYSVSWAPFSGGALQFSFAYSESLSLPDNTTTRSAAPSIRWNIRPGATFDLGYLYSETSSPVGGAAAVNSLTTTLRITL